MRRSVVLCLAVAAIQASTAAAQTAHPWAGVVADEARTANGPIFGYGYGDNEISGRAMSTDGRFVVFDSSLSNLVYGDTNNWNDVFLRDRQTGELTRVSVASDGSQGNNYSAWASISSNGRYIAFHSCATNFDPADTNNRCDLFIHDRENGTTIRANFGPTGEQATDTTQHYFRLSGDGRYLVFSASFGATARQVWLRDRDADANGVFDEPGASTTTLISEQFVGTEVLSDYQDLAISSDGRWIAYVALAEIQDWPSYASIGTRVYLYDRVNGTTSRVDRPMANGTDTYAYASGPDFSESGTYLVYSSSADNLAEGDTDGRDDVYVFNVLTGGNVPIELTHAGAPAIDYEWGPSISADGRYVTFTGVKYLEWWNTVHNVYVVDRQTGQSYEISVRPDGSRDDHAWGSSISADGSSIAFSAGPEMVLGGWGYTGVFVATNVALSPAEIDVPGEGGTFSIDVAVPEGIKWTLNTQGAIEPAFSAESGVGPATIDVTVYENPMEQRRDFSVQLGSEQVILHQAVRPRIYALGPDRGGVGTTVTIYGNAFAEGATISIGGLAATDVTFLDSHDLRATTPAHSGLGWVSVTVTNPDGTSATLEDGFLYMDTTGPVVTYEIAGTPGQNGWYTSDVTVTWTYEDPESAVGIFSCTSPYTQTTEGSQFAICYVYSDGDETFADVELKKDSTPPIVAVAPSYGETYAQGEQVPTAYNCFDSVSGIATCTLSQGGQYLDTSAVGTFELSATAVDVAGNSATTTVTYTVKMWTQLTVPAAMAAYGGTTATLRATLTGPAGPLAGKTITFFVDNAAIGTAITAANGEAILSVPLGGRNAGSYEMHTAFAGDDTAFASMAPGSFTVDKATPVVTWATPSFIVAGTPLGSTQLNATASVAGSFVYTPGFWAVPAPGTHTLTVQFTPQDSTNYEVTLKTVTLKVKAIPVITWTTPAAITYPAVLGGAQLNATASVAGSFVYNPPAGTLLDAGTHTIEVTFTAANTADYVSESSTTTIDVLKGTVTINWPNLNPITYGAQLTGLHLNATASAEGGFTYSPPYGTILNAGTHTVTATFTPNWPYNYQPATATRQITVNKAYPVVYWQGDLAPIVYGTPLGAAQLYATSPNAGTITYDPPAGTLLDASQNLRTVRMTFTPDDTANYNTVTYQKNIAVVPQTTAVTWSNLAPIVYGTALGAAQLNATGSQPGTFTYNPPAGTVLNAGTHTLSVYFTPSSPNYYGGSWTTTIVVAKRTPVLTWTNPASIVYGAALSAAQLNATANVAGTFAYSPSAGTVLGAGTRSLAVTFTPSDASNNNAASASTAIVVSKATPVITWPDQGHITYGTALSAAQLNATATVPGSFAYSPDFGAVLPAGNYTLSATFTPTDSANFATVTDTSLLAVFKQTAVVTWATPAAIPYGAALSAAQLNATANVPGTFVYIPAPGTVLNAGTPTLFVNFTPDDTSNYQAPGSVGVTLQINKAAPIVTWANPAGIPYGTALSATQLNATANVAGTFAYSPASAAVLGAGTQSLSVTFTPTDSVNYTAATGNASIVVGKATPVITWANPSAITFGTALSATQLNATANVAGTFAYSPASGSVLNAGTQPLSVTFTPTDSVNYNGATANASIVVNKATTVITWTNPAGITYGTALSSTQLNATANVPGSFAYSPAAGAVLGAGTQSLSVTFTPADGANYTSPSAAASIVIAKKALTIQANSASKVYGAALPVFTATGTGFVNGDSIASLGGTLAFATSATATSTPAAYAVTPSGATSSNYTISFAAGTLTVTKASTSVALTTTPSPSANNQSVQLRAMVSAVAPGAGTATGTIEFRDNGTLLGTATLVNGVATLNKTFKRGAHPLTATYAGDTNFNGSSGSVAHQTQ